MKKFFAFGVPLLFLVVLAIGLLGVSYQLSLPTATPTTSPIPSPVTTGTVTSGLVTAVSTTSIDNSSAAASPREFFKDVFLVLASGLITLSGYFISAFIQSGEKDKEEIRELRKTRTKVYRDYLQWLLSVGQHSMIVAGNAELKQILPKNGAKFIVDGAKLEEVVEKLPLAWELSEIGDDGSTKRVLDHAISQGIKFVTDLYSGQNPDYPAISAAYQSAIDSLDRYERYG